MESDGILQLDSELANGALSNLYPLSTDAKWVAFRAITTTGLRLTIPSYEADALCELLDVTLDKQMMLHEAQREYEVARRAFEVAACHEMVNAGLVSRPIPAPAPVIAVLDDTLATHDRLMALTDDQYSHTGVTTDPYEMPAYAEDFVIQPPVPVYVPEPEYGVWCDDVMADALETDLELAVV